MPTRLALAALVLLALAPFAFWPAYLSRIGTADGYTHTHAVLGTCWLLMLVAQPLLIRASARAWHRHLGRMGVVVGIAFVVSGVLIAHRGLARMDAERYAAEGHYVYLPLAMSAIFALALAMALRWRRDAAAHGRYMAATALALLDPLIARILYFHAPPLPVEALYQVPAFTLCIAALVAMASTLPPRSAARGEWRSFAVVVSLILFGFFVVPDLQAWQAVVAWFRALPLT